MNRGERGVRRGRKTRETQHGAVIGGEILREEDERASTCLGLERIPAVLGEKRGRTQAEAKGGEKAAFDDIAVGINEAELVGDTGSEHEEKRETWRSRSEFEHTQRSC